MENLIVTWAGLVVLFWLILSDCLHKCVSAKLEYTRADVIYRSNFGDYYKRWFIKSRRLFAFAVLKIVFAASGLLVFSVLFTYFLISYLISL